jgi:hypothetical protein
MLKALIRLLRSYFKRPQAHHPQQVRNELPRRVAIPLYSGAGDPPPGFWKECSGATVYRFKAELTCPFGHGMTLKGHEVEENGSVSPSVVCPIRGCEFHEFVVLAGWRHGRVKKQLQR